MSLLSAEGEMGRRKECGIPAAFFSPKKGVLWDLYTLMGELVIWGILSP